MLFFDVDDPRKTFEVDDLDVDAILTRDVRLVESFARKDCGLEGSCVGEESEEMVEDVGWEVFERWF